MNEQMIGRGDRHGTGDTTQTSKDQETVLAGGDKGGDEREDTEDEETRLKDNLRGEQI